MSWFNRKKQVVEIPAPIIASEQRAQVEIVANKNAKQATVEAAAEADRALKKLLDANHFTVTIMIAAGGKLPEQNKGRN